MRDCVGNWVSNGGTILRLGVCARALLLIAGMAQFRPSRTVSRSLSIYGLWAKTMWDGPLQSIINPGEASYSTARHNRTGRRLHNFERVSALQQIGFLDREELHTADLAAREKDPPIDPGIFKIGRWVWGHSPEVYARDNYCACLAHLKKGELCTSTNLPPR